MLLLLGCTAAVAEPVQQGVLPMKDIREFGAIGDGRVDDTSAIQAALQGGGLIVVPAGRYLTGTLYLESDTELRLAPGAELLASTDPAAYNPAQFSPENTLPSVTERVSARHLLIAIGKKNITLSGGRINGNAPGWMPERPVRRRGDIQRRGFIGAVTHSACKAGLFHFAGTAGEQQPESAGLALVSPVVQQLRGENSGNIQNSSIQGDFDGIYLVFRPKN